MESNAWFQGPFYHTGSYDFGLESDSDDTSSLDSDDTGTTLQDRPHQRQRRRRRGTLLHDLESPAEAMVNDVVPRSARATVAGGGEGGGTPGDSSRGGQAPRRAGGTWGYMAHSDHAMRQSQWSPRLAASQVRVPRPRTAATMTLPVASTASFARPVWARPRTAEAPQLVVTGRSRQGGQG